MSGGGNSSPQTVTQTQQIPQWEQDFAQGNQNIAASIASQPYPSYQGQIIAPQNWAQQAGMLQASNYSNTAATGINAGLSATNGGLNSNLDPNAALSAGNGVSKVDPLAAFGGMGPSGAAAQTFGNAGLQTFPNSDVGAYMSPYVQQSLAPQLAQLNIQHGQDQNAINASATQAGAFGDARNGVQSSLNDFYNNIAQQGVVGQGYNNAFNSAQSALQADNQNKLSAYGIGQQGYLGAFQAANQASLGQQSQNLNQINAAQQAGQGQQALQFQGGNQLAQLGALSQRTGIEGANALYGVGQQMQTQQQNENNAAYQQYENQVNWPQQMLNIRESALSNSPYNITNATTLPGANSTASNLGLFAQLAGMWGSGSSGAKAPFGGQAYQ